MDVPVFVYFPSRKLYCTSNGKKNMRLLFIPNWIQASPPNEDVRRNWLDQCKHQHRSPHYTGTTPTFDRSGFVNKLFTWNLCMGWWTTVLQRKLNDMQRITINITFGIKILNRFIFHFWQDSTSQPLHITWGPADNIISCEQCSDTIVFFTSSTYYDYSMMSSL